MISVLVTGGNGQLAKCIHDSASHNPEFKIIYADLLDLDITNLEAVSAFFKDNILDYCINCAAYTAVDKAEKDKDNAFNVNVVGAKNLANACNKNDVTLIHISTDFVFDGLKSQAYKETDNTNPTGVYGLTKLNGEEEIKVHIKSHFIIRTAWLYSEYGNNFMKTMIALTKTKAELNVVDDQIGTPTYAPDLAKTILHIINSNSKQFGLYHYSNEGVASWYDFAKAIFEEINSNIKLNPIKSKAFPTAAIRPHFSVLDKTKIKTNFKIEIQYWRDSLKKAIKNYNEQQS